MKKVKFGIIAFILIIFVELLMGLGVLCAVLSVGVMSLRPDIYALIGTLLSAGFAYVLGMIAWRFISGEEEF
jgi:hypothetical protein